MVKIRRAKNSDSNVIDRLLHNLELWHSSLSIDSFWVAEDDAGILGCVHLEDFGDNIYLSSLGVTNEKRGQGIASALLKEAVAAFQKDIFIYTIIPDFFEKQGFIRATAPNDIPGRSIYNCAACCLNECKCMVLKR
jgi:N-acetylglutamate synthase-like GNAT family acetyltransferase